MSQDKKESRPLLNVIDDLMDILNESDAFYEVVIRGKKTSIIITKPTINKEVKNESK